MRRRFNSNKFNAGDYLSFVALEDSASFSFGIANAIEGGFVRPVLYNIDGIKWEPYNGEEITINNGQVLSIKAGGYEWDNEHNGCIHCSSPFEVFGNILSIYTSNTENYQKLFFRCTSLVNASYLKLPATTLTLNSYAGMFEGCTSLTTAPALPATTLAPGCYYGMFKNCTSLTTAPTLPATTLADYCYGNMFQNCSKLNYIKMLATDISATGCLTNWVSNVASTGTFVKNPDATWEVYGNSGIPNGWTVKFDGEEDNSVTLEMYSYYQDLIEYLTNKYGFGVGSKRQPIPIEEEIFVGASFAEDVGVGQVKFLSIDAVPSTLGITLYLEDYEETGFCVALDTSAESLYYGVAHTYFFD